jgi:hypothetical protein
MLSTGSASNQLVACVCTSMCWCVMCADGRGCDTHFGEVCLTYALYVHAPRDVGLLALVLWLEWVI